METLGTVIYQQRAFEAKEQLALTTPLAAPESDRRHIHAPEFDPLVLERLKLRN